MEVIIISAYPLTGQRPLSNHNRGRIQVDMSAAAVPIDREAHLWNKYNLWNEEDLPEAAVSEQFDSWLRPDLLSCIQLLYRPFYHVRVLSPAAQPK